jgi:hypothetical protein
MKAMEPKLQQVSFFINLPGLKTRRLKDIKIICILFTTPYKIHKWPVFVLKKCIV